MVVLVILGLLGSLLLTRGPPRSAGLQLQAVTSGIAQTLRAARTRSIATNRPVTVLVDPWAMTVRTGIGPVRTVPPGVTLKVTTTADQAGIQFLPDGSSSGGRVDVAAAGRHAQVGVDWISGRVTVAP